MIRKQDKHHSRQRHQHQIGQHKLCGFFSKMSIVSRGLKLTMYVDEFKLYAREGVNFFKGVITALQLDDAAGLFQLLR